LAEHHRCRYVCATCYDSKDVLYGKYPRAAEENINKFLDAFAGDARGKGEDKSNDEDEDEDEGLQKSEPAEKIPADDEEEEENGNQSSPAHIKDNANNNSKDSNENLGVKNRNPGRTVLFSVDARKLGTAAGGGKEIRHGFPRPGHHNMEKKKSPRGGNHLRGAERSNNAAAGRSGGGEGPWDIICFNFPHVGGISTDVNRQVRANQELLVAFFKTCVPLLSSSVPSVSDDDDDEGKDPDRYDTESEFDDSNTTDDGSRPTVKPTEEKPRTRTIPKTRGQILVTLFEGEPYTLWNIRDLARHAGLQVVTSFRFPWKSYPGYSHSRTVGVVESRKGKKGGGWKGEDREARTYVFEVKGEEDHYPSMGGRKRAREDSSDDDE
jgi:25S rRNA (uracil2634-N3)-methyltransferase